jgi:DNA-binding Lrp family transcriptional regulator
LKNKDRNKEKIDLTLSWTLEWRVSSLDIIAARLGLTPNHCTRFFKKLLQRNILERIKVQFSDKRDLVILGPEGHKILGTSSIAYAAELTRVRRYTKKRTINHDLEAQKAALKMLPGALEIISDFNIQLMEKKPDILVFQYDPIKEASLKIAVEMEKTAKDAKNMYWVFNKYLELLERKEFDRVKFFFSHDDDMNLYVRYFERDMWPTTGSTVIKGKSLPTTVMKTVATTHPLRRCFSFELLKPDEDPSIFTVEEASKLKRYFVRSYFERMKTQEFEPLELAARKQEEELQEKVEEQNRRALEARKKEIEVYRNRVQSRKDKIAWFRDELARAEAEDSSLKAWKPGYKFQSGTINKEYDAYLLEQIEIEERANALA